MWLFYAVKHFIKDGESWRAVFKSHNIQNLKMASQTVLEWVFLRALWDLFLHCSVQNEAVLCEHHTDRSVWFWTSLSEERKKQQTDFGHLAILWFSTFVTLFRTILRNTIASRKYAHPQNTPTPHFAESYCKGPFITQMYAHQTNQNNM